MSDEQKPPEPPVVVGKRPDLATIYVGHLGADMAGMGTMEPVLRMAVAMGMLLAAGQQTPEEGRNVSKSVMDAFQKAYEETSTSTQAIAAVQNIVKMETEVRVGPAVQPGGERTTSMSISVPDNMQPDDMSRIVREAMTKAGVDIHGLAITGHDGTLLYTEGNLPSEMLPVHTKAPAGAKH